MAITITKKGIRTFHGKCTDCKCEFTYEDEDVHYNYAKGGKTVSCPQCGEQLSHHGASGTSWPVRERDELEGNRG